MRIRRLLNSGDAAMEPVAAIVRGRHARPLPEGAAEGAELRVAEQERDLGQGNVRLRDIAQRQLAPGAAHEVVEADVEIAQAAVERPAAHTEFGGDLLDA